MFKKMLIANHGDKSSIDGLMFALQVAKPKSLLVADRAGDLAAEVHYV